MSDPRFPDISGISTAGDNNVDARDFISAYTELRNAYLHSLSINHSMRRTISNLTREYSTLWDKYSKLCADHDILLDDHTSDL